MLYEHEDKPELGYSHTFDYQVFTFYGPKLGRIQVQEFHVRWNWVMPVVYEERKNFDEISSYLVHLTGQKQLFMSQKCIENTDWQYLR